MSSSASPHFSAVRGVRHHEQRASSDVENAASSSDDDESASAEYAHPRLEIMPATTPAATATAGKKPFASKRLPAAAVAASKRNSNSNSKNKNKSKSKGKSNGKAGVKSKSKSTKRAHEEEDSDEDDDDDDEEEAAYESSDDDDGDDDDEEAGADIEETEEPSTTAATAAAKPRRAPKAKAAATAAATAKPGDDAVEALLSADEKEKLRLIAEHKVALKPNSRKRLAAVVQPRKRRGQATAAVRKPLAERGVNILYADELDQYEQLRAAGSPDNAESQRMRRAFITDPENNKTNGNMVGDKQFLIEEDVYVLRHRATGDIVWGTRFCCPTPKFQLNPGDFFVPTGPMLANNAAVKAAIAAIKKELKTDKLPADAAADAALYAPGFPLPTQLINYCNTPPKPRGAPAPKAPPAPDAAAAAALIGSAATTTVTTTPEDLALPKDGYKAKNLMDDLIKRLGRGKDTPKTLAEYAAKFGVGALLNTTLWRKNLETVASNMNGCRAPPPEHTLAALQTALMTQTYPDWEACEEAVVAMFDPAATVKMPLSLAPVPLKALAFGMAVTGALVNESAPVMDRVFQAASDRVLELSAQNKAMLAERVQMEERLGKVQGELGQAQHLLDYYKGVFDAAHEQPATAKPRASRANGEKKKNRASPTAAAAPTPAAAAAAAAADNDAEAGDDVAAVIKPKSSSKANKRPIDTDDAAADAPPTPKKTVAAEPAARPARQRVEM